VVYEIFREIRRIGRLPDEQKIVVGVHPSVAGLLYEEERQGVEDLEREYSIKIIVKADQTLHLEQYDIVVL
jgi:ribonuclease G